MACRGDRLAEHTTGHARLAAVPDPLSPPSRRVLETAARKGVAIEIVTFPESTHTADEAARAVGAGLGQIVKSLVFVAPRDDGQLEPFVVLVAGPDRVNVAQLAAVLGEPSVRRATAREANELTGFAIGGIPPFGHERPIRVVMDPGLGRHETVWAAAGTQNAVFPVSPGTLRMLANATVAPIAEAGAPAGQSGQIGERAPVTGSLGGV
jgi:prolyl-tRNA editing enzyme YbaK/EbsC (Cys-tRNA(Pro) deacylase)